MSSRDPLQRIMDAFENCNVMLTDNERGELYRVNAVDAWRSATLADRESVCQFLETRTTQAHTAAVALLLWVDWYSTKDAGRAKG